MRALLPFLTLFKHAKFHLILGIVLMLAGMIASIGLMTLSGWFLAATAIAGIGTLFNYFYPSASVRGLAIGRTAARYVEKIVTHDATFRVLAKLRVQIFSRIIPLSPGVLNQYRNSDLLNRLVADVDTLDSLYLRLVAPFITALSIIVIMTIGLSFVNVGLALFIGISLLVLLSVIPTLFYQLGKRFGAQLTQARSLYRVQFVEFIQAQAELLLFNAQNQAQKKLEHIEAQWQNYQQKEANLSGLSTALLVFFNGLLVVAVLWFVSEADLGTGLYKAAMIALFTFCALASFEMLMPIGAAFLHIGQVIASAERVSEITQQTPMVKFTGTQELFLNSQPLIQAENITFQYPNRSDLALNQLNLTIFSGQKTAILGKTGSGKSTLLQLLVRNYDALQGQLLLAGKSIEHYTECSLRKNICFLTQRVHVFSDTLRNNLQIANENTIDDQRMQYIVEQVGLGKLLQDQGLDLWLGDGGRPLSGGEQRRLGLARILLNDAPILLLDEPTEGLDRETERHILNLILQHAQNKTLIMVTHRLTALAQFDLLCVMDNAKLIEQGSYSELLNQESGFFKRLVERI
ncbi:heme ABC transporter ATP-binding protein/permease CydC [Conservatibacter flavescens]|uniref:Glutathione/L-cysteine transport system ATP-binding/permease protein CydC n=1 Tax=Conservatibacter flavescens TaxID=28161 RepID=A0A2M8S578_9PAST|nr:cysteine/glutathione ABC transporter ATP-binding protein/permease CydC [Conservatibacter flavescens]PJG86300.1 cysteine/glutathione ABC transporter ATP-binding protein/permease CydC [Conservatibacter flavescens]